MATKVEKPLLMDELTLPEKVMLGQLSLSPGYQVLVKMMEAACENSRLAINDVNPEEPGYVEVLKARQQYSRAVNKFCVLVLRSIDYHKDHGIAEEQQKELEVRQTIESQGN
jgi:hypothetical protein